jgi:hypothetical protein
MRWLDRLRGRAPQPDAQPASETDPAGQLLGQSLLRLEINTILKTSMTGEPMQALPHALLDLAKEYAETLLRLGATEQELRDRLFPNDPFVITPSQMVRALTPTFDKFGALRSLAFARLDARKLARGSARPDKDDVLLDRIVQGCEVIIDVTKRLPRDSLLWQQLGMTRAELLGDEPPGATPPRLGPYPELTPTQMLRLRKVWDIGTEEIVAQTTIHLTGDVLMRLSPRLLQPEGEALLRIHKDAVAMSTGYWHDLMNAAVTLATGAASALLGKRRP